jgi:hypothetical protein
VPGFALTESLAGRLRLAKDGEERPMVVTIHGESSSIVTFLRRRALPIEGVIDAPGLADHRRIEGAIDASGLFTDRRLAYAFTFVGDDGATYAFTGEKSFVPRNLVVSFTLLAGVIRGAAREHVGDVLLRFDLRGDLRHLVQSLRFTC